MKPIILFIIFTSSLFANKYYHFHENGRIIEFDLLDPDFAPEEIKEQVKLGRSVMDETHKHAPDYVGNALSCTHCHFCGGNTVGRQNGGISLVGIVNTFPQYSEREKKTITLTERIQNCFLRSLNGKAPPEDCPEMKAMITYLEWIGSDLKGHKNLPWIGLKPINMDHKPNLQAGEKIYEECCIACHREHGEGMEGVPPICGYGSFNKGAGMYKLPKVASFIYWNMPYKDAVMLTNEEAIDVAAYILSKPRPDFNPK